ncbi:AraC family transcriptional regulator [Paenibacillus rhizovicinus]|uniref:AraC family transcriptional regulator n=1 Tax=Paenibacillus rhizovicinus TaxID=2704463 RepID=A0A6C0P8H2_9BACL|nr:AraC family transcriptional regulator [Paenibacillus rhizovicinus]QHW34769.1 AraC family transcriptional regulator [Paenibacillus rhizovicinus]
MQPTMITRIEELQLNLGNAGERRPMLHILNGQAMADQFAAHSLRIPQHDYAPFNEAMCANETCDAIFSDAFIRLRAAGHGVSMQDYDQMTIQPMKPLFEGKHDCIVLWFGDDMFCQMNMLTVLAYLQQTNYKGSLIFHQVNEQTGEIAVTDLPSDDYDLLYRQVLVQHASPATPSLPILRKGIELYLEYKKPENEITAFIKDNEKLSHNALMKCLFRRFPHYGLGDTQYVAIMEAIIQS